MNIKNCKITLVLLLSLSLIPAVSALANSNSLTQLDIRKNNASSVDITLYTTTPYNDSVAVTKKSDNKYVILMPNVAGATGRKPDLSALKDVISNVDIKSVNDASGSYTKVTLITTKPLNIKTHTQKSLPVTEGQKAYRELLANTGTHTNAPVHIKPAMKEVPQTVVTVNKPAQPVKLAAVPQQPIKPVAEKKSNPVTKAQSSVKPKAPLVKQENTLKNAVVKKETQAIVKKNPEETVKLEGAVKNNVPELTENAKTADVAVPVGVNKETDILKNVTMQRIPSNMPITLAMIFIPLVGLMLLFKLIKNSMQNSSILKKAFLANLKNKKDASSDYEDIINADMNWQEKYQKFVSVSNKNYEKAPKKLASESADWTSIPAVSAEPVEETSFAVDNLEKQPVNLAPKIKKVKPSANKQKSKVEINEAVKEMERQINKLEAENSQNISNKVVNSEPVINEKSKQDAEAEYVASLEQMLHNSPDLEKTNLEDDIIINELEQNFRAVQSEDNVIASKMSEVTQKAKVKKLKAFASNSIMEESHRNRPLPKTAEEVKRAANMEGRHVNLGYSKLHSNPRLLEGANLSAADLIAKSSRFLPKSAPITSVSTPAMTNASKPKMKPKPVQPVNDKGYSMATVEEFLSMTDEQSKVTASQELSNKVAGSLANIKPSMKMHKSSSPSKMSNPISQLKSETQENYLNGLIVKSGYNIDKDRGFYLVNLDGEMALIGRIKEEIFVLKKFDTQIEKPLQVRQDNPNVYMVKTDGFRSLVEVNDNKMGVLIEL